MGVGFLVKERRQEWVSPHSSRTESRSDSEGQPALLSKARARNWEGSFPPLSRDKWGFLKALLLLLEKGMITERTSVLVHSSRWQAYNPEIYQQDYKTSEVSLWISENC